MQWDPKYRIKVRVICARAYHALFMVRHLNLSDNFYLPFMDNRLE